MDAHAREPSGGVESAEDGFLSRASRGSVAFRVGESGRERALEAVSRLQSRIPDRPQTNKGLQTSRLAAEIFFLHAKGHPHCPPRFGRGSSPPARRDGVEVGPETRDRGVRRGDARPRHRQRARAPGRSHREQVRRACVTKDTAERNASSPPTPTSRATVRRRTRARVTHMPRRASEATAKVGRWRRADDRAVRHRAGCASSRSRADDRGNLFLFFRFATRASRPFPERRLGELERVAKGHRNVDTCAFFLFRPAFVASDRFYSDPKRL